jgi:8-oxo-dGTP pyrophosphatase MutT (NUDIX family)
MTMSSHIRSLRAHVGTARLLAPSVAGIVRDAKSRILLVQQRDDGRWSTPGGAIEMDETPADAVVREVWEETGLLVTPTRLLAIYGGPGFVVRYPNGDETQYVSAIFECDVKSGTLRADGDEVQAARYWSLDEAARLPLSPWLVDVLPRLYEPNAAAWFDASSWRPT